MDKIQSMRLQVNKIGNVEDYLNIPIVESSLADESLKAIGVVTDAIEHQNFYELKISMWTNKFLSEYIDGKISAITI